MNHETILNVKNVQKFMGLREIFKDVNCAVHAKDKIALVGQNGQGKTTLLKIMLGLTDWESGEVEKSKGLRIGYLPQHGQFESLENDLETEIRAADKEMYELIRRKSEIEEVLGLVQASELETTLKHYETLVEKYENARGYTYEARTEKALKDFGFKEQEFKRRVKDLSGGEKTRLGLAKLALQNPDLLILDEPTNHLDLATIVWLEKYLMGWEKAIVLVSHDRVFLDQVCKKTWEIYQGHVRIFNTNYSGYLEERQKIMEAEEKAFKRQQKYLEKQEKFVEKFRYKATKASAVQSRIKMLDKIERVEAPQEDKKQMRITAGIKNRLPVKVMELEEMLVFRGEKLLVEVPGKIEIHNDAKIGIIGANGAGKTSLIQDLMQTAEEKKNARISGRIKLGYYAQTHDNLDEGLSVLENVRAVCHFSDEKIRGVLGGLLFTGDDVHKNVADLSGGEKAKVSIAKLVLSEANFLVLDEPTNHLDIESRTAMVEFLKNFDGPILMISHDRYALNEICNHIWEIKNQKLNRVLGNYNRYAEIMQW